MTTMIERVARAIYERSAVNVSKPVEYEDLIESQKCIARSFARAAIEAMREPTPAMINGMRDNIGPLVEMWHAAIDAALLEQQP